MALVVKGLTTTIPTCNSTSPSWSVTVVYPCTCSEHRRGKSHTNADALSRLPCRQCGRSSHQDQTDALIAMAYLVPPENMGELQRDDPHISPRMEGKAGW